MESYPPPEEFRKPGNIVSIKWGRHEEIENYVVSLIDGVPHMLRPESYQDFVPLTEGQYVAVWRQDEPCDFQQAGRTGDYASYFTKLWPAYKRLAVRGDTIKVMNWWGATVNLSREEAKEVLEELKQELGE